MPGINSRRVFINQNRDRVKNPTEMYAFPALRLGRIRNKQRDKHYEVAAAEASSVINARTHRWTYTRKERERERRERGSTRVLAKNLRGSAGFTGLEKHARRGRIPINFDSTILYRYTLLLRAPFPVKRDLAFLVLRISYRNDDHVSRYIYIYSYRCFRTRRSERGEARINYFE